MFLAFLTFVCMTAGFVALVGFGLYRVATHLRGNEQATKAVVDHVILPLFGKSPEKVPKEPEPPAGKEVF